MSSFRNAAKSHQKTHRERAQPSARAHLGILQKKKDYKLRADDFNRKKKAIQVLKRKALDKNPDEFYFKMIKSKLEDGVHTKEEKAPEYTPEQLKLMQTQDLKYINYKRSIELKKIERLKSGLHLLDVQDKPKNKHVVFVDSKKEAANFDAASYLKTHPALLDRTYNRLTMDQLKKQEFGNSKLDPDTISEAARERDFQYNQLNKRIEREKQLKIIAEKMEMKRHLLDKKTKRKKVEDETVDKAAIYKWVPQRKR